MFIYKWIHCYSCFQILEHFFKAVLQYYFEEIALNKNIGAINGDNLPQFFFEKHKEHCVNASMSQTFGLPHSSETFTSVAQQQ